MAAIKKYVGSGAGGKESVLQAHGQSAQNVGFVWLGARLACMDACGCMPWHAMFAAAVGGGGGEEALMMSRD
jgi:hypothetical protein